MSDKKTVMEVFDATAKANRDRPALRVKRDGRWVTMTWGEYHDG
jgi:hypothetical protein